MIQSFIKVIAVLFIGLSASLYPMTASAAVCNESAVICAQKGQQNVGGSDNNVSLEDNIKIIVNVLMFLVGAIAVIVIIIGGIRYTTSSGDPGQTKSAKDTVLYAVIGFIVAILSYAIVNFVLDSFTA